LNPDRLKGKCINLSNGRRPLKRLNPDRLKGKCINLSNGRRPLKRLNPDRLKGKYIKPFKRSETFEMVEIHE